MTITTGIPTNLRAPRTFHSFLYSSGNRSLVPTEKRVALIGMVSAAGTLAAATPTEIFDTTQSDALAGVGSELALMARAAFAQFAKEGKSCRLFLDGVAAPGGGAARVVTLTVTGPATESGTLIYRIAGRPVAVGVTAGDTADTIAAALEAAIDALVAVLPVTASSAAAVVTCTATHKGANGGDTAYRLEQGVAGVAIAYAQSVAGAGTVDLTTALDALAGQRYDGIAVANGDANDVSDLLAHLDATITATAKRWRRVFLCEPGNIGAATVHAGSFNSVAAHVLCCEGVESLPGEVAAAMAVAFNVAGRPNANLNGHELVGYPPVASSAFTETETETALSVGVTPLVPVIGASGAQVDGKLRVVKLTTTRTEDDDGNPVEWPRLPAVSQVGWSLAEQIDAKFGERFGAAANPEGSLMDDAVLDRVRDLVVDVLYTAQDAKWIRNVDDVLPSIVAEIDNVVADRVNVALEYVPVVPFSQAAFVHRVSQSLSIGR